MILTCFQNVGCFQFCEKVKKVQNHQELIRIFILNLHNKQSSLAGIDFELLVDAISSATGIPDVGEKWFKREKLDMRYYEPFIKPRYKECCKTILPFSHSLDRYAPLMKVIMKYFTCEGRYSKLCSYHIILLMHFTRVKMLHFPYYLYKSIDKMSLFSGGGAIPSKCIVCSTIP